MKFLRDPIVLMLLTLLLGWAVFESTLGPEIKPANSPDGQFSAARAENLLIRLYPDNRPHVSGSLANAAMRDRIVTLFEEFGYTPEVQTRFHCRPDIGRCSPVENIIARRQGAGGDAAILLTAHYDSGWAGPGVSDDGAGVAAILEIARMASQQDDFEYSLIFLITDAEEMGLLGADAFARHHPLFEQVRAVINLEARGSTGASVMFETGPGNRGVIRMVAKNLDRPVANSLSQEVYRRMPNDTDFSIYRNYGLPGVNFAFTGGASIYHSLSDDRNNLDPGSLQHHGQNAWSMLHAMDERNLERVVSEEDAAYVDLFGRTLLHYPMSSAPGLALVLSVLVLAAISRTYSRQVRFRQVLWTTLGILLLAVSLPALGWALSWPLGQWVDAGPLEHPFPWVGQAVLLLAVLWALSAVLVFLAPRVTTASAMATSWGVFVALSLVLAYKLPVAGYLGVLPLLAFTLGLLFDGFRWKEQPRLLFSSLLGYLAAAYLGFYFFFQLDVLLNFKYSMLKTAPLLLPAIAALPLLLAFFEQRQGRGTPHVTFLLLIVSACAVHYFIPGYRLDAPRDMTLMVRQDEGRPEPLLVLESSAGTVDADYARNHGFEAVTVPRLNGPPLELLAKELPDFEVPVIVAEIGEESGDSGEEDLLVMTVEVPEGLEMLVVEFEEKAQLQEARLNGQVAFDAAAKTGKQQARPLIAINHPPAGSLRLEFEYRGKPPSRWEISGRFPMPEEIWTTHGADWPADAQPAFRGPRVVTTQRIEWGE